MTNKRKVMIGDESLDYGLICADMLRSKGFEVLTEPKNGQIICDAILKEHPDVVIIDALMQQMDAIKLLKTFKDIANRWLLVKEIDAGTTQREIANKFSMSLCKITRGSRELNKEDSAFRKMLELLKNQ